MSWFRLHTRHDTAPPQAARVEAHRTQEITFRVGDRVKIGPNGGWSAGSTGEITNTDFCAGSPYEVMLDDCGLQVDASAYDLQLITSYEPHVFQVGNRVRLAQEFVGNIWEAEADIVAGEGNGPNGKGDPVSFLAGSTGTVGSASADQRALPPTEARYLVDMDRIKGRTTMLVVRGINLERIPGRTRIVSTDDGIDHVLLLFSYRDMVRLRKPLTGADGSTYEVGWLGSIDVESLSMPVVEEMGRCWETGVYTVRPFSDQLGSERGVINVHGSSLQLDSDFRASPYE